MDDIFTPLNQIHSCVTRSARRGAFFWQAASSKYGKRCAKHLGHNFCDYIDPSLSSIYMGDKIISLTFCKYNSGSIALEVVIKKLLRSQRQSAHFLFPEVKLIFEE